MGADTNVENSPQLQIEARIEDLKLGFRDYSPEINLLLTETGRVPYPADKNFDPGGYLRLVAAINNPNGASLGEMVTPLNTGDENLVYRLMKQDAVLNELRNPQDTSLRDEELLNNFILPQLIATKTFNDLKYGAVPVSMLYEYEETELAGSVHLVTPGKLKTEDMRHIAQLIGYLQRIGDNERFAYNPFYTHRFMGFGPDDGNYTDGKPLFKWTRDLPVRDGEYRSRMGDAFADGLQHLVDPDDLKILFTGKRVMAFGNLIWCNWGINKNGILRLNTTERTTEEQTESDVPTGLSGLVSDPPRFYDFFHFSIEQFPTHMSLEHWRRGFLLNRYWNWVGLKKSYDQGAEDLKEPVLFFKQQALDALHRENLWDSSKYPDLTDEPLQLKY